MAYGTKTDRRGKIALLRHQIVGDSRRVERQVNELVKLVKEEERDRVMTSLEKAKEATEA